MLKKLLKWICIVIFLSGIGYAEITEEDIWNDVFDTTTQTLKVIVVNGPAVPVGPHTRSDIIDYIYDEANHALKVQIVP